jgi:hypothetical protein
MMIKSSIDLKNENSSEASFIELVLEISDNDHTNKVYCGCFLCAKKGYGGAWLARILVLKYCTSGCN